MSVNDQQVGGNHYKSSLQHWDFVEDNGIGYLEACATKYITRHRKKNGKQDVEKAEHYVEKLISLAAEGRRPRNDFSQYAEIPEGAKHIVLTGVKEQINKYIQENHLGETEGSICRFLLGIWEIEDLQAALFLIRELIDEYNAPRVDNTGMEHPFGYNEE